MAKEKNGGFHFTIYPEDPRAKAYHEKCNAIADAMSKEEQLSIINRLYTKKGAKALSMSEFMARFYP